uniref:Uncharacterized protein n=1 Tax=Panagrellus redivivus TaxID=6233 RepID=A0A7E5A030_PANRE
MLSLKDNSERFNWLTSGTAIVTTYQSARFCGSEDGATLDVAVYGSTVDELGTVDNSFCCPVRVAAGSLEA